MTLQSPVQPRTSPWRLVAAPAILGAALLWAFWPTLGELAHRWGIDPQYSHGYLVPAFAVILLWLRRDKCPTIMPRASGWGLALLAGGLAMRFAGEYFYLDFVDAVALLPCLVGLTVLLGGKATLRWAWPAIAFLAFMIPLPFGMERVLAHPLQRIATLASTYALQTLGLPALSEGNVILVNENRIGVVEACSGLSMLMIFFALSTAVAFVTERPLWHKLLLVASAVPIALIANVTRITVTGVMHVTVGHKAADLVFHDLAGWLMMPFALVLLWIELKVLAHLFVEVEPASLRPIAPFGMASANGKDRNRGRQKKSAISPVPHNQRGC